jgi:Holliday junction DNA helicase RuvB
MEDFAVDIVLGKGPAARTMRIGLPKFTLVGATTRLALLTGPLRDRFGSVLRLDFYSPEAMEEIVVRSADVLAVPISPEGARALAHRARGTPRVANRLLKRARDFAEVRGEGAITRELAGEALQMLDIDVLGLDDIDRRILRAIVDKFGGGPVGIETLAAAISEETDTVMDVYEPYLIQLGFLQRTPRGRVATEGAYAHLGIDPGEAPARQTVLFGAGKR